MSFSLIKDKTLIKDLKENFITVSYIGPELFKWFKLDSIPIEDVDLYKNDVHSMGIVFLYI